MIVRLYRDRSVQLLFVLGTLLSWSYLMNAISAFDDLSLPAGFSNLVRQHGYLKTISILVAGIDMPYEYRTYGLSRALQFALWAVIGDQSLFFPLFIALSQLGSAVLLLLLVRERGMNEETSLAVAVTWLISPFAVNWCFHHYTYLILPFQIVVTTCFVLGRITTAPYRHLLAAILGVACALTGELQLIAGPVTLLSVALLARNKERLRLSYLSIGAMIITLITHRWFWNMFTLSHSKSQRFEVNLPFGPEISRRALAAIESIPKSILEQVVGILSSGFIWGILIGFMTGLAYWAVLINKTSIAGSEMHIKNGDSRCVSRRELKLALILLCVALSSLAVYLILSILTGQLMATMPRRYGFVPLTLLLIVVVIGTAILSQASGMNRRLMMTVVIGLIAALAGQLHSKTIPNARALDLSLSRMMRVSGGLNEGHVKKEKGVILFVSSAQTYLQAAANNATVGPKGDSFTGIELLESDSERIPRSLLRG